MNAVINFDPKTLFGRNTPASVNPTMTPEEITAAVKALPQAGQKAFAALEKSVGESIVGSLRQIARFPNDHRNVGTFANGKLHYSSSETVYQDLLHLADVSPEGKPLPKKQALNASTMLSGYMADVPVGESMSDRIIALLAEKLMVSPGPGYSVIARPYDGKIEFSLTATLV